MENDNSYVSATIAALLFIAAGIVLIVSGYKMVELESIGRSSVAEFYYNADGIANIGWGIFCFAIAIILISISNNIFKVRLNIDEQKNTLLEKLNNLEKQYNQPKKITEAEPETLSPYKTFNFTEEYIEEWPLNIQKIQLFAFQDTISGELIYQNKSTREIRYSEWELKGFDVLHRPICPGNPLLVKVHATIEQNESVSSGFFKLPEEFFDVEVNLAAVVYTEGQVEYMPETVNRYKKPPLKKLGEVESKEFTSFVVDFLKDKGVQATPKYFHDSTDGCWNCAFCGAINSQKNSSCRNCNIARKVQLYVREEFLCKKFSEFNFHSS